MSQEQAAAPHPLARLFEPRSIAVVGASTDPAKRGHQILWALGTSGYRGRILPVNPKAGTILGHLVHPTVQSLPDGVDLAVLCTPAASAPELVAACGARGIGAVVVLAVGFAESGADGAALQRELVEAAKAHGVRVVGPNTSGVLNLHLGVNLIGARDVRPGGLALVVQSGNMALALMNEATARSWDGISICVGVGNEADVGFAETLSYLEGHEDTRAVIVYAEGFSDPRAFLEAAASLTLRKPLVLIKSGRTERSAATALSHTGAVAGPYDRLCAGMRQAGIVEVRRTDELLHVAETLARQPVPAPGQGIAILSDGGGQGTLAVDLLVEAGVPLAGLSDATRRRLRSLLGPAAAVSNPVDLAGAADSDPTAFADALDVLAGDPEVGSVLVIGLFGGYAIRFADRLAAPELRAAQTMARRMTMAGKGLVIHSMYASHRSAPLEALGMAGVPVIESLDVACRAVIELHRRGAGTASRWEAAAPELAPRPESAAMAAARAEGRATLTEPEARALLEDHGVPFAPWRSVPDEDAAARALAELGAPVALKVVHPRIVHKTDAGGVALGIRTEEEARAAFTRLVESAGRHLAGDGDEAAPGRTAVSALVTPMAATPPVELLVGAYREPGLGPVLTVGAGGVWVEVLEDVVHRVLPVDREELTAMLDELTIRPLLDGHRGAPRIDRDPVVDVALAIADVIWRYPDVSEIEINPLFVHPDRVEPVDARVLRRP